jgi:Kef-type K+ transport system membrane component KefB
MIDLGMLGEIGIAIASATVVAFLAKLLRQPLILAYMVAGLIIGPAFLGLVTNSATVKLMSELGIAFLLFLTGLEINFRRIKQTAHASIVAGILQVALVFAISYFASTYLGFSGQEPIYLGIALSFCSTMIAVKLLSDKGELETLHGRIIVGILMIQDVIAIGALTLLPSLGHLTMSLLYPLLIKGLLLFSLAALTAKFLVPHVFKFAAKSQELLFLTAISWCLAFAFFSSFIGYSLAIGAFLAGLTIASSAYNVEIIAKVRPLRDFFSTLFFVSIGMQLVFSGSSVNLAMVISSIAIFSCIVIFANPLIVAGMMAVLGYTRKTSVLSGLSLTHISEFSLIVIYLGNSLGVVSDQTVTIVVAVAAITIAIAGYLIKYDTEIYGALANFKPF